jgi:WD40 repeat protein
VLYAAGSDNCVTMYNTKTWKKTGVLKGHTGWVNAMIIDEKRKLLYTASDDQTVMVWDLKTQESLETLEGHDGGAISLELLGSQLVVGCTGRILVWDTKSWKLMDTLTQHTQVLRAMSDGKQMSKNMGIDPRIVIAREAAKLVGQKIGGIASSKHHMFSAVDEGSIWVWEKRHLDVERKLLGPQGVNMDVVWVRSLEVMEVPHPTTGRPCLKL